MGQAIVYCFKCQEKVLEADFEAGRAFKAGGRVTCSKCAVDLVMALEGEEQAALLAKLKPGGGRKGGAGETPSPRKGPRAMGAVTESSSRSQPRVSGGTSRLEIGDKSPGSKLAFAIGGAILVILLILLLLSQGNDGRGDRPGSEVQPTSAAGGGKGAFAEKVADQAIEKARNAAGGGVDLDALLLLWEEAVRASEKTTRLSEARTERDRLLVRRKEVYSREWADLEKTIQGIVEVREWSKATEFLKSARKRHENVEWTGPVDRCLAEVTEKSRKPGTVPREGLALWLRADQGIVAKGTRVSRWQDQSDGHRDATQDNGGLQPTLSPGACNGKPGLLFDGARTSMTIQFPINGLGGITLALVTTCLKDSGAATGSDASAIYWDAAGPNGKTYLGPFQSRIRFKLGAGKPNGDIPFLRPSPIGTRPTLTVIRKEGTVDSLWIDGSLAHRQTEMGGTIAECADKAILGIGKNNTHFSGAIAEIVVFARALSEPERQDLERYLMDKYALPSR
jgi:hypothetical protein